MHNFQLLIERTARDIRHYLSLIFILTVGFYSFAYFSYNETIQVVISVLTAASYVVWGIVHHHIHGDLFLSVVLEYVAIASLGLVIIFSLLY